MEKKCLFITEDNIEIFENDKVYYLTKSENFSIRIIPEWKSRENVAYKENLHFAKRENIEEYVIKNKPCLSLKDIENIFGIPYSGLKLTISGIDIFDTLKLLVKKKLNF